MSSLHVIKKNLKVPFLAFCSLGVSFFNGGNNLLALSIVIFILSIFLLNLKKYRYENFEYLNTSILILIFYLLFQIVPLPKFFFEIFSSKTIEIYEMINYEGWWHSISLNSIHSLKYLLTVCFVYLIFKFIPRHITQKKDLVVFINSILLIGFIHVTFGLTILLFEIDKISLYHKEYYLFSNTGFFINRNNFSLFLILMFHLSLYQLNYYHSSEKKKKYKSYFYNLLFSNFLILRLVIFIFVIGIILTKSRIGNLSFGVSLIGYLIFDIYNSRKFTIISKTIIIILILDIIFLSQYFGIEKLFERYLATSFEGEESRFDVFLFGLKYIKEFPIFGYGVGNFENIFRIFYGPHSHFYNHVHNDYIEYFGELGLIGIILVFLIILSYRRCFRKIYHNQNFSNSKKALVLGSTISILIHISFDFSLHMPANIILVSLIYVITLINFRKIKGNFHL